MIRSCDVSWLRHCTNRFGSWTYDGLQVDLDERIGGIDLHSYDANCYEVVYHESRRNVIYYEGVIKPYPDILITLHLLPKETATD